MKLTVQSMGIKGLSTQLRPYACKFTLSKSGYTQNDSTKQAANDKIPITGNSIANSFADGPIYVIIDGPSLAYCVYHRCIISASGHGRSLGDYPSYVELGSAAISLLNDLEAYGLHVDSIFFDGHLPETKVSTRQERLETNLVHLRAFRSAHLDLGLTRQETLFRDIYRGGRAPGHFPSLPTLPFLVPAILESLQRSQSYGHKTKTVPGEADLFCKIRSEEKTPTSVLSNDSDVILLHPNCKVIFFNDLEFDVSLSALRGLYYMPCTLAKQLGCQDLVKLGYQLARHSHLSLKQCASRLKNDNSFVSDESYQTFSKAYSPLNCISLDSIPLQSELRFVLQRLDPRVSEYVLGWLSAQSNNTDTPMMYLPPLVDDPLRGSAWRPSSPIRRLAYSILASASPHLTSHMNEVDRRGDRIVDGKLKLYDITVTNDALRNVTVMLDGLAAAPQKVSAWRLSCLVQLLTVLRDEGSNLPHIEDVHALFTYPPGHLSWAVLHLHAQLDGIHYSLRILKQVLNVYTAFYGPPSNQENPTPPANLLKHREDSDIDVTALHGLQSTLKGLPTLQELHTPPGESSVIDGKLEGLSTHLAKFYPAHSVNEQNEQPLGEQKSRAKKRERKSRSSEETKTAHTRKASTNPYSILEEV